jgi:hypothetical protein
MTTARTWPPDAYTVITDEWGYPMMTESLDVDNLPSYCRGYCNNGSQPCKIPHVCNKRGTLHRIVDTLSHPSDEWLRSNQLSQPHDLQIECDRAALRVVFWYAIMPAAIIAAVVLTGVYADDIVLVLAGWMS